MQPKLAVGGGTPSLGRLFCAWNQTHDRRSGLRQNRSHVGILSRGAQCQRGFPIARPNICSAPKKTGSERFVLGEGKSLGAERRITDAPGCPRKPAQQTASHRRVADQSDVRTKRSRSSPCPQKPSEPAVLAALVVDQHFVASWQQVSHRCSARSQADSYPALRPFGLQGSNSGT